ncbi:hypothetical protein F5887DRAFT_1161161 [Amanita rubescens]|nr:hypothetical protein F5887DRAFT_1161161 [Amanita rubescens]
MRKKCDQNHPVKMSVASRAPIEILCEIFLLLCDKPIALHDLTNSAHADEFPWAVGQICSHWRSAFLSCPTLWASLSLNPKSKEPLSVPYIAEMNRRTAFYLKRSRQHPLIIFVHASTPSFSTIGTMLLSCSNRWKKADLRIGTGSVLNGLGERRGEMQILESLKVTVPEFIAENDLMGFEIAPHLAELELAHWAEIKDWTLRKWIFPWTQLSKLRLEIGCLKFTLRKTFRTFLLQIQNVEELQLFINFAEDEFDDLNCPSVHFPRLKLLEISLVSPRVFSWFEAPLLEHLFLHDSREDEYHGEELSSFVQRSSCCVRRLTIQFCEVEIVRDIIKVLTEVEEFCVKEMFEEFPGDFVNFVQDMIHSRDIHLPNLRVVQVPCCPGQFMELILEAPFLDRESGSAGPNFAPLEKLIVTVDRANCNQCGRCGVPDKESRAIEHALKDMCQWPSFSVIRLTNYDRGNLILTLHALAATTVVDLAIHYLWDPEEFDYYSDNSYRHYNILENKRLAVNT